MTSEPEHETITPDEIRKTFRDVSANLDQSFSFLREPEFLNALKHFNENLSSLQLNTSGISEAARMISESLKPLSVTIANLQLPNFNFSEVAKSLAAFSSAAARIQGAAATKADLKNAKDLLSGRKSGFQAVLKELGQKAGSIGPQPLELANTVKQELASQFETRRTQIDAVELELRLATEGLDMSLPVDAAPRGTVHPVSQVMEELAEIFADLGFAVAEGPEIEDDWHNFTALNIPESHPARAMHDTFYFEKDMRQKSEEFLNLAQHPKMLLRTHTSPVQIRAMMSGPPPIRIIAPGRTYRSDSDATHTPMFHQVEGLVIDRGIHMGHLKWTLETFLKAFFERDDVQLRLRPSYFPFTEPSAEVDVGFTMEKGRRVIGGADGFMEVLGSGMVHPKVIAACGLDPDEWQGFAFGCGIDRLAMLKYGMDDLRAFFDGDLRWLRHYGFAALAVPTLSGGIGV